MRWIWIIVFVIIVGCGSLPKKELPSSTPGSGSDELRVSPCACDFEDFDQPSYEWMGS